MAGFYDYLRMGMGWHSSPVTVVVETPPGPDLSGGAGRIFAPFAPTKGKKKRKRKFIDGAGAVVFSADTDGFGYVFRGPHWQESDDLAAVMMMFPN